MSEAGGAGLREEGAGSTARTQRGKERERERERGCLKEVSGEWVTLLSTLHVVCA